MNIWLGLAAATLLLGSLTLAGCADWRTKKPASGFVAGHPAHHRTAITQNTMTTSESALSKCNQDLYLKSAGSQDDIHSLEAKCRVVIRDQPY